MLLIKNLALLKVIKSHKRFPVVDKWGAISNVNSKQALKINYFLKNIHLKKPLGAVHVKSLQRLGGNLMINRLFVAILTFDGS